MQRDKFALDWKGVDGAPVFTPVQVSNVSDLKIPFSHAWLDDTEPYVVNYPPVFQGQGHQPRVNPCGLISLI